MNLLRRVALVTLAAVVSAGTLACSSTEPEAAPTTSTTTTLSADPEERFHQQYGGWRVTFNSDSAYDNAVDVCDEFSAQGPEQAAKAMFTNAIDMGAVPELLALTRAAVRHLCPEHSSEWAAYDSSTFG